MDTFLKYHLVISKERYRAETQKRSFSAPESDKLSVLEIAPDYDTFRALLNRVGGPWGWPERACYENRDEIEEMLAQADTRLFLFRRSTQTIGFSLVAAPLLGSALAMPGCIEIEKFGLYPEHTGKKYGRYFLPALFEKLFESHDSVYLNTRNTNHAGVVPFYESLGMHVFHSETLPDDRKQAGSDTTKK